MLKDKAGGNLPNSNSVDLYSVVKKKWWIIIICIIIVSGLLFLKQSTEKSQYEASVLLTIRSKNFQTSYSNPEMASAYLKSDSAVDEIIDKLNAAGKEPSEITGKINVAPVGDFLKIYAIDSNPKAARNIANAAGEVLLKKAYDVARKKLIFLSKRVSDIEKSLEKNEALDLKITGGIVKALTSPTLTDNERVMISAWQAQVLSSIEQRNTQLHREKLDLELQINNIQESAPQVTKSSYSKKLSRGLKSSVAIGIIIGVFVGFLIATWLEFWQQKKT